MTVIDPVVEVKVTNMSGQGRTLRARTVSSETLETGEWNRVFGDGPDSLSKNEPLKTQIAAQLAWIYGGKKEDYDDLDIRMQKAAVMVFTREYRSPSL